MTDRAEQTDDVWEDLPDDHEYPQWTDLAVNVVTEQPGRHTVLPDGQVWVEPPRAEQAQPSGYTPPPVGAYTDVQCGDPHPSRPGVTCTKAARHIRRPEPQVAAHGAHTPAGYDAWVHEGESGYTPPEVGAPTWPRANPGATISERGDRLEIEWPNGRGMSWVAPKVIEGWVEQVNELRAERARLRAAVAKVRRGEPLTEAELALAEVAW